MKNKTIVILLVVIGFLLAANLAVQIMPRGSSAFFSEAQAQTPGLSGSINILDQNSFIITSDQSGENVYVYWFDRDPRRERSTIKFITKARARD
jgi:flagellar basal body-associated protein FliL